MDGALLLRWVHVIGAGVLLGTGAGIAFFSLEMSNQQVIQNMLCCATLATVAALAREESRGTHVRSDFPTQRPEFAVRRIYGAALAAPRTVAVAPVPPVRPTPAMPSTRPAVRASAPSCARSRKPSLRAMAKLPLPR